MREIVYIGHDNSVDYILKENDVAVSLTSSTRMTVTLSTLTIGSTNGTAQSIRWSLPGYATGEVRLFLGNNTSVNPGNYDAPLVAYGPDYPKGLVWGNIGLLVKEQVENT